MLVLWLIPRLAPFLVNPPLLLLELLNFIVVTVLILLVFAKAFWTKPDIPVEVVLIVILVAKFVMPFEAIYLT